MFRTAWTIGRLRGIPLRLHVSLLLVVPLFAAGLTRQIEQVAPGPLVLSTALFGVLMSIAIFLAIALHELGHGLVARRQGARVQGITLMILGGVTEIERRPSTPMQDLQVAAAGPAVNLGLGVVALLLARLVSQPDLFVGLFLFGEINLALGLFNLVPAFPMDGGRILKALFQLRMPEDRAVRIAATIGRTLAMAAMGFGLIGGHFGLALVGLFVYLGAGAEAEATVARVAIHGHTARQAMATRVVTVLPSAHVAGVARHMLMNGAEAALVRDLERTYGVLLVGDLLKVEDAAARDLLAERRPLWVEADDALEAVVQAMQQAHQPAIVRDAGNAIIGIVTWEAVERLTQLRGLVDADRPTERVMPDNATPR
jgi:Zn-dependent protease